MKLADAIAETSSRRGFLARVGAAVMGVAGATPKRHYYFTSPRGRRLFELGLGPVALSFLATPPGSTTTDTRRRIEALIAAHGTDWPAAWLEELGLDECAERYRASASRPRLISMAP